MASVSDNTVRLWNLEGTLSLKVLNGHSDPIYQVDFSSDSRTFASVSSDLISDLNSDHMIKFWSLDGEDALNFKDLEGYRFLSFYPRKDKSIMALASRDNAIKIFDFEENKSTKTLGYHDDEITDLKFSPNGKRVASVGRDNRIKLWNIDKKDKPQILDSQSKTLTYMDFSPDSQIVAFTSKDNTIKLWKLDTTVTQELKTLGGHEQSVNSISFDPNGKMIASASRDTTIKLWSLDSRQSQTLSDHTKWVNGVSFSPNGKMIASASNDHTVKLWNRNGEELTTLNGHGEPLWDVKFSPDGTALAAVSRDETVLLWNLELKQILDRGCDWLSSYLATNPNLEADAQDLCR